MKRRYSDLTIVSWFLIGFLVGYLGTRMVLSFWFGG